MSLSFPVTAGIEQTKLISGTARTESAQIIDQSSQIPTAADLSVENQQSTERANSSPSDPDISSEQVRVSVTTGQSSVRGNLSRGEATNIYQQIAKFL